jgi:hypothetical protein
MAGRTILSSSPSRTRFAASAFRRSRSSICSSPSSRTNSSSAIAPSSNCWDIADETTEHGACGQAFRRTAIDEAATVGDPQHVVAVHLVAQRVNRNPGDPFALACNASCSFWTFGRVGRLIANLTAHVPRCALSLNKGPFARPALPGIGTVGSEEARSVALALASVRRSNGACSFPALRFRKGTLQA